VWAWNQKFGVMHHAFILQYFGGLRGGESLSAVIVITDNVWRLSLVVKNTRAVVQMEQRFGKHVKIVLSSLPYAQLIAEVLLEIGIIVAFLKTYNMTRNLFGSQACSPSFALGHAEQIIVLERLMGIFWEQEIQGGYMHVCSMHQCMRALTAR